MKEIIKVVGVIFDKVNSEVGVVIFSGQWRSVVDDRSGRKIR